MTTSPFFGEFTGSDKSIELVKKITEKTQSGKITWQKTPNGLFAGITGLRLNIVEASSGYPPRWLLFSVRDDKGTEILKVENPESAVIPIPSTLGATIQALGLGANPVLRAVNELYLVVRAAAKGEIEKAIDLIDKI